MAGNEGKTDPLKRLTPAPLRGGATAATVLAELRNADDAETTVVARPWFRGDSATPWGPAAIPPPLERRVERTGRIRLPYEHQLEAVRQELGMRARDHIAAHAQQSLAAHIVQRSLRDVGRYWFQALHAELRADGETEAEALKAEWDKYSACGAEYLADLDAFGVEHGFPSAVARSLGAGMAQHRTTPWGALTVLKEHVEPTLWRPPVS